ncbi:uncharacterized protein JN550_005526 [Neoarthrinium moseri]|uniref:uncharacterized protein n=1 Tax=Neoarthrinium moseri TaxID=1658444 RepID=UPI001FDBA780|nr:uncharacterized protein JN550_005526 [Neoarthrinium moseri]KAI1869936.1 hypothetical protein JN550_005526 [Neoarthrinium moseri]
MSSIDLGLLGPDDDENEKKLAITLQDLVNDKTDAASAAKVVDLIVTDDCQKALSMYNSASEDEKTNDSVRGPAPQGWQQYLYDCLASAAMKVPASHPGQDRLVNLMHELGRLPRHFVPALYYDPQRIVEKEIWVLTRENNYDGFGQWMWERHEGEYQLLTDHVMQRLIRKGAGTFAGWRQVETDSNAAAGYLNFSAFLARLLSSGAASLLGLSALVSPFATRSIAAAASREPQRYEPYIAAAAQWILYAGDTLYEMSEMKVLAMVRWKRERWDNIKAKFEAAAEDDRFSTDAREWATKAVLSMKRIEEQGAGGKKDVVASYKFPQLDEDDEEEADK